MDSDYVNPIIEYHVQIEPVMKDHIEFINLNNNSAATLINTRDGNEIKFSVELGNNKRLLDVTTNFKEMIILSKYLLNEKVIMICSIIK